MKLSDYVAEFIEKLGVKHIFLISGGGMMHLLDSVGSNKNLNIICNLNEQASSICADVYGQYTENIGVCMLTTGPGGTNAVTGIASAYLDSTPVLAISGQCKTSDFASKRGVRQFGAQEVEIVDIVKPITKYAVKITNKDDVRYCLEKAVYIAKNGRKGPVWIDIPLDIQASQINVDNLRSFDPIKENMIDIVPNDLDKRILNIFFEFKNSKRPLILIGGGLVGSGARNEIKEFIDSTHIPVLSTWRAKDVFEQSYPFYFGAPGIPTTRYSNYILQNCDFILIIGTRLNPALTAYDEPHFAFNAKKIIVDIDLNEIEKLNMIFEDKICCNSKIFMQKMLNISENISLPKYDEWLDFCNKMKNKYPIIKEKQPLEQHDLVDAYLVAQKISELSNENDDFAGASSGRVCGISHMAFDLKQNQRFISSMGLGSMGFVVPTAISMCLASNKKRIIALEGDGSLQHNVQELQLIKNYDLPVKLFVLSNSGYASIYIMQQNNFKGNYVACNIDTNVEFPKMKDIANAYGLDYYKINNNDEIDSILNIVMSDDKPVLCEIITSINFDEIPKSKTIAHSDGTFSSSNLENLYPFLSEEEVKQNMPSWE